MCHFPTSLTSCKQASGRCRLGRPMLRQAATPFQQLHCHGVGEAGTHFPGAAVRMSLDLRLAESPIPTMPDRRRLAVAVGIGPGRHQDRPLLSTPLRLPVTATCQGSASEGAFIRAYRRQTYAIPGTYQHDWGLLQSSPGVTFNFTTSVLTSRAIPTMPKPLSKRIFPHLHRPDSWWWVFRGGVFVSSHWTRLVAPDASCKQLITARCT